MFVCWELFEGCWGDVWCGWCGLVSCEGEKLGVWWLGVVSGIVVCMLGGGLCFVDGRSGIN